MPAMRVLERPYVMVAQLLSLNFTVTSVDPLELVEDESASDDEDDEDDLDDDEIDSDEEDEADDEEEESDDDEDNWR